jgi:hypothetical protein
LDDVDGEGWEGVPWGGKVLMSVGCVQELPGGAF